MRKILKYMIIFCLFLALPAKAFAQIKTFNSQNYKAHVIYTGFTDYTPLGSLKYHKGQVIGFSSVFSPIIDMLQENTKLEMEFEYNKDDYLSSITKVRGGNIDLLLGMYYDTELYDGIDFVFPSILNNPISIITLPGKTSSIKSISDLKKLKGAVSSKEKLSDYVVRQMKEYNLEKFDDSNAMYEKLFKGEIDFVFASHYFGMVDTSQLGIRKFLSFSKQIIWNMPLFLGVSKLSKQRNFLINTLSVYSNNPETKKRIEQRLIEMVRDIENKNAGVLPPAYVNAVPPTVPNAKEQTKTETK